MAFPPCPFNHVVPVGPFYPMWGTPHPASILSWGSQGYYPWQPTETWHWKPYPGVHADAWGCPVMLIPPGNCSEQSKCAWVHCSSTMDNSGMPRSSVEHQPAEEVIDEVVKEAISKPWLPLPLGLNPPSTDNVIAELSRQGISTVPLGSTALIHADVTLDHLGPTVMLPDITSLNMFGSLDRLPSLHALPTVSNV